MTSGSRDLVPGLGGDGSTYDGGEGDDEVVDLWGGNRLDVDLKADEMTYQQGGSRVTATLAGFETVRVQSRPLQRREAGAL